MKILLVGEYSGLHLNLKAGLEKLGHQVTTVGFRDGYKQIPIDIDLSLRRKKRKHHTQMCLGFCLGVFYLISRIFCHKDAPIGDASARSALNKPDGTIAGLSAFLCI